MAWTPDVTKSGNPCDVDLLNDNLNYLYDNKAPKESPVFTGGVIIPNATESNHAVALGQLINYLLKTGGTLSGDITIDKNVPRIFLKSDSSNSGAVQFFEGASARANIAYDPVNNFLQLYVNGSVDSFRMKDSGGIFYHNGTTEYGIYHGANCAASLVANGYQKLASGLILQWGTTSFYTENAQRDLGIQSFPVAFPNACLTVTANFYLNSLVVDANGYAITIYNATTTGFGLFLDLITSGTSSTHALKWVAIGY